MIRSARGEGGRTTMWSLLYDSRHADSFDDLGEAYGPLRRLVNDLGFRDYAGRVHAFASGSSFILTTAPSARQTGGQEVGVEYDPARGMFAVGYLEGAPASRYPRHRVAESRVCAPDEVGEVIDGYVRRMLPGPEPVVPEM